jgi:hypothetical protein
MNSCLVPTESLIRQAPVESGNDANDFVIQLHHRWNNSLKFPPSEVGERYCRDDLGVVLKLSVKVGVQVNVYSLLITRGELLDDLVSDFGLHLKRSRGEAQDEFSVLIDNVYIVDREQGAIDRIGGVVRLKRFDQAQNVGVCNSLYFSFTSLNVVFVDWPRFENGEFDSLEMLSPVGFAGELPNNMVKTRPQVMRNLADENTEAQRDVSLAVVLHSLSEKLQIVLWQNGVLAFFKKPIDLDLKIEDVLVGPF